jgi:hypothetical protein
MTLNPIDASFDDDDLHEMFSGEIPRRKRLVFYLDENLSSPEMVETLDSYGLTITTAGRRGFEQEDSDFIVLSDAKTINAVFVTRDKGYENASLRITSIEGLSYAGIMIFGSKTNLGQIADHLLRRPEARRARKFLSQSGSQVWDVRGRYGSRSVANH